MFDAVMSVVVVVAMMSAAVGNMMFSDRNAPEF